jgi:hypothetical protein
MVKREEERRRVRIGCCEFDRGILGEGESREDWRLGLCNFEHAQSTFEM